MFGEPQRAFDREDGHAVLHPLFVKMPIISPRKIKKAELPGAPFWDSGERFMRRPLFGAMTVLPQSHGFPPEWSHASA